MPTKKYEPKHQLVKDLKVPPALAEVLDGIFDKMAETRVMEYVALGTFVFGTYSTYNGLLKAHGYFTTMTSFTEGIFPGGLEYFLKFWGEMLQGTPQEAFDWFDEQKRKEEMELAKQLQKAGVVGVGLGAPVPQYKFTKTINWTLLGTAMIMTYAAISYGGDLLNFGTKLLGVVL